MKNGSRTSRWVGVVLVGLVGCSGCSEEAAPAASAPDDVGTVAQDTGTPDAGVADSGAPDAGPTQATIDPSPFGMHPAVAVVDGIDPYQPAHEAGLTWTRDSDAPYVFWALVDPEKSGDPAKMIWAGEATGPEGMKLKYDYDHGIGGAIDAKLSVMWNIAVEPEAMGFAKSANGPPVDESKYAAFVKAAIGRYPKVRVWQVGNEPNLTPGADPKDFAALQKVTYEAIKAADPGVTVVLGGVGGGMTVQRLTDDTFFDPVLDALKGCCVDVFDIHFYGDPLGGTTAPNPTGDHMAGYQDFDAVAKHYREHLDARGFQATRIWTTENGTYSGKIVMGPDAFTATEAEQARDLPKRTVVALALGVEKLFWAWSMVEGFGQWDDDFFDHTGLIYNGHGGQPGTRKLSYWALWQMTRQLDGCEWAKVARLDTTVAETRAYRCPLSGGGEVVVAWWDTFNVTGWTADQTVALTVPWTATTAVQRSGVPSAASGADVTDPEAAFATTTLAPEDGQVTLTLGADPVWVRVK